MRRRSAHRAGAALAAFVAAACISARSGYSAPIDAAHIPAFARQYRTTCTTCHTAPPKLNVLGEAFRLNGYRLPDNPALIRRDVGIPLGDDAWKELWPRAIWPGELPTMPPVSLRILADAVARRGGDSPAGLTLQFPSEIYMLAGSSLGENVGVFLEMEWTRQEGLEVKQAKIEFQNPLPWLPHRAANLWIGKQNPYLLTFGHQQIDQAGQLAFRWQEFRVSDMRLTDPARPQPLASTNAFVISESQPGIEINGLLGRRAHYAVGVAQPERHDESDAGARTNAYYRFRYKLGGLRLDGRYDLHGGPQPNGYGQLLDRAVILEHFGYFGSDALDGGTVDKHRSHGASLRVLDGRWDTGVGVVVRHDNDPWALGFALDMTSVYGKAEYLPLPWVIASLKAEWFRARSAGVVGAGYTTGAMEQVRFMPGAIALIRQNVRFVVEGELYSLDRSGANAGLRRPSTLWTRLDFAF
jgi:hypothetical protein